MIPGAICIRQSSDDRNMSIQMQETYCRAYAAEVDPLIEISPEHVYKDHGISGASSFDSRPGWQAMCQAIEAGKIKVVFVYALDRLGRSENPGDMFNARTYCIQHGVRVFSVRERLEVTSVEEMDLWRFFISAMQARRERLDIKERTWRGQKVAAQNAECHAYGGRPPYGFDSVKGVFVVNEAKATVVRRLFDLAAQGVTCEQIAARLNQDGIPGPMGGKWHANTIWRLLKNPAFIGSGVKVSYTDIDTGERHTGIFPAPALVDLSAYNAARRHMALRRQVHAARNSHAYWLSGIVGCAECGRALIGTGRQGYRYYACPGRTKPLQVGLTAPCAMPIIKAAALEEPIWRDLAGVLSDPSILAAALSDGPDQHAMAERLAQIEGEISACEQQQVRLTLDYAREVVSPDALRGAMQAIAAEVDKLNQEAMGLQMRGMALGRQAQRVEAANLDSLPPVARGALAREMIAGIETAIVSAGVRVVVSYYALPELCSQVDTTARFSLFNLTVTTPSILIEL